jgi:hypothetical protein
MWMSERFDREELKPGARFGLRSAATLQGTMSHHGECEQDRPLVRL